MLVTSKDLLLVVIALCLIWLTAFSCWGIYYLVMILRDFSKMTASIRKKMEMLDTVLKLVKEKLESTSLSLGLLVDGVSKIVKYFQNRQKAKKPQKK